MEVLTRDPVEVVGGSSTLCQPQENRQDLNLGHLSKEECDGILKVIQRDFTLRQKESQRLDAIDRAICDNPESVDASPGEPLPENGCSRCRSRFIFFLNPRETCPVCGGQVCHTCAQYDANAKVYRCHICVKQLELQSQSCDWFYSGVKNKFNNFGSAKVVRSLYKRRIQSQYEERNTKDEQPKSSRPQLHGLFEINDDEKSDVLSPLETSFLQCNPAYTSLCNSFRKRLRVTLSSLALDVNHAIERRHQEIANGVRVDEKRADDMYNSMLNNHSRNLHFQLAESYSALENIIEVEDNSVTFDRKQSEIDNLIATSIVQFIGHPVYVEYSSNDSQNYEEILSEEIINSIIEEVQKYRDIENSSEPQTNPAITSQLRQLLIDNQSDSSISPLTNLRIVGNSNDNLSLKHKNKQPLLSAESGICFETDSEDSNEIKNNNDLIEADNLNEPYICSLDLSKHEIDLPDFSTSPINEFPEGDIDTDILLVDTPADALRLSSTPRGCPPHDQDSSDCTPLASYCSLNDDLTDIEEESERSDWTDDEQDEQDEDEEEEGGGDYRRQMDSSTHEDDDDLSDCPSANSDNSDWMLQGDEADLKDLSHREEEEDEELAESTAEGSQHTLQPESDWPAGVHLAGRHRRRRADLNHRSCEDEEDEDEEEGLDSDQSEDRQSTWSLSTSTSLFCSISAYDNYGDKKVGRMESLDPLYMHMPDNLASPRIGGKDITDIHVASDSDTDDDIELEPITTLGVESNPMFTTRPNTVYRVEVGEYLSIECAVKSNLPTDIFWYRSTQYGISDIDSDFVTPRVPTGDSASNRHCLELLSPTKDDRGQYLCLAINEKGRCCQSFKLKVKDFKGESRAPEFIHSLNDLDLYAGDTALFTVKLKGYPSPAVLWYKDGQRLKHGDTSSSSNTTSDDAKPHRDLQSLGGATSSDIVSVGKSGNRDFTLTLAKVTSDSDAEFMCVARNVAGEARCSCQLIVNEVVTPVRSSSPVILRGRHQPQLGVLHGSEASDEAHHHHHHHQDHQYPRSDDTESMQGSSHGDYYPSSTTTTTSAGAALCRNTSSLYPDNEELMAVVERSFEVHSPALLAEMDNSAAGERAPYSPSPASPPPPPSSSSSANISSFPDAATDQRVNDEVEQIVVDRTQDTPAHEAVNHAHEAVNPAHGSISPVQTTASSESFTSQANISLQNSSSDIPVSLNTSTEASITEYNLLDTSSNMNSESDIPTNKDDSLKDEDTIDCGLHRVNSTRYNRDFIVNRSSNQKTSYQMQKASNIETKTCNRGQEVGRIRDPSTVSMPSVNSLRSKFKQDKREEEEAAAAAAQHRVYSLTGRDLPSSVRKQLIGETGGQLNSRDHPKTRRSIGDVFPESQNSA